MVQASVSPYLAPKVLAVRWSDDQLAVFAPAHLTALECEEHIAVGRAPKERDHALVWPCMGGQLVDTPTTKTVCWISSFIITHPQGDPGEIA